MAQSISRLLIPMSLNLPLSLQADSRATSITAVILSDQEVPTLPRFNKTDGKLVRNLMTMLTLRLNTFVSH